jgi:hypothetical protein
MTQQVLLMIASICQVGSNAHPVMAVMKAQLGCQARMGQCFIGKIKHYSENYPNREWLTLSECTSLFAGYHPEKPGSKPGL